MSFDGSVEQGMGYLKWKRHGLGVQIVVNPTLGERGEERSDVVMTGGILISN